MDACPPFAGVRRRFFSTSSRSLLFTTRVLQMFPDSLSSNIYAKEGRWTGKTGCEEKRNGQGRPCRVLKEASNTRGQYWGPRTSDRRGAEGMFHTSTNRLHCCKLATARVFQECNLC